MTDQAPAQPDKTKLYLAIALGVVCLILVAVVVAVYLSGGDVTAPAGAAAASAAAAAEAARRQRNATRAIVGATLEDTTKTGEEIKANRDEAVAGMDAVEDEVAGKDDDELKSEGEDAFGPSGSA
jgi:flagellar basal body-associated protein FliL